MYSTRLLAFVLAGSVLAPQLIWAQQPAPPPAGPATVQQPGPVNALAQRVREARDPSSVIQAYADARAVAPTDLEVQRAYVHRMAELGLPEMASQQAQDLLIRAPEDGVAWAVAGYLAAKRDQMDSAATDLAAAAQLAPDDPFVQRTGAQIVAWADSRKSKTELSPQAVAAVATIRSKLSDKPEYAQAYQGALEAYQRLAQATTTPTQPETPAPSEPAAAAPDYDLTPEYYNPYVYSGGYAPSYVAPYYSSGYAYAQPYWYPSSFYGSSWWGNSWWWPTASSFIIVDDDCRDDFRHHHKHHSGKSHAHHNDAEFRDPHFFNRRGQFGDRTDPGRHFAMSPLDRGDRTRASQQNDGQTLRTGGTRRSNVGTETSPSPNRVASPAAPSGRSVNGGERVTRSEPRVSSPAVPPARSVNSGERVTRSEPRVAASSALPSSGRPANGGERITQSKPSVSSPAAPSGRRVNSPERVAGSEPRVSSPAVPSGRSVNSSERVTRSDPRMAAPAAPSGRSVNSPERVTRSEPRVAASPAAPSGRSVNSPGRVTRSEPRVGSPGAISSPSARGGSSGVRAMPPSRSSASFESRARPAGAAISPGANRSGGFSGRDMSRSGGGSRSSGGRTR